jgi:multidrug efflux pump subunit AcrA (membrane-fusion protein)
VIEKTWSIGAPHVRSRWRAAIWLALGAAVGIGILVWRLQAGGSGTAESLPIVKASRADLIVSVGGVGRIVEASAPVQLAGGAAGSAALAVPGVGGGATSAPVDAVFPGAAGHVSRLLVGTGQHVAAGQPIALLDDGGTAVAAVAQVQNDLDTARLELRQREVTHPVDVSSAQVDLEKAQADLETLRGAPAARSRAIALARRGVVLAQERLSRVLAPPSRADLSVADADVKKAEADLAALLKPPVSPLPESITAAEKAVESAQQKLTRATGPADPAAVAAADAALKRAQADLSILLKRPDPLPTATEIEAAKSAVEAARLALLKLQGPPDPADVSAAQFELDRALSELAVLRQRPPAPSAQAVAAAQQAVDAARLKRTSLTAAKNPADVTAARLDLAKAKADLQTLRAGAAPLALRAARKAVETTQVKLARLLGPQLDLELARVKVAGAEARLNIARFTASRLTVRAPSAGTVTALLTVPGAPVDASTPIATVTDLQHLAAQVDLSEFDVARVKRGMKSVVRVDALGGKSLPAKVLFTAFKGNDNNGVVTFPVRVSLRRAGAVRPGMSVSVRIIVAQRRKVVKVPLEAVTRDDEDRSIVSVMGASGEPSIRKVTLGLANNDSVEIVKGLKAGARVVLPETQGGGGEGE